MIYTTKQRTQLFSACKYGMHDACTGARRTRDGRHVFCFCGCHENELIPMTDMTHQVLVRMSMHTFSVEISGEPDTDLRKLRKEIHRQMYDEPEHVAAELLKFPGVRTVELWKVNGEGIRLCNSKIEHDDEP